MVKTSREEQSGNQDDENDNRVVASGHLPLNRHATGKPVAATRKANAQTGRWWHAPQLSCPLASN